MKHSNVGLGALVIFGLVLIFQTQTGLAEEQPLYKKIGDWDIRVDRTMDNGCFLLAQWEGGSLFRAGFDMSDLSLYVIVGDPSWKSIDLGRNYPIEIYFGDEDGWEGNAQGFSFNRPENAMFLQLWIMDEEDITNFLDEFMREEVVDVRYEGESIAYLQLTNSAKAGSALLECQRENWHDNRDPFMENPNSSRDPFRE